MTGLIHLLAQIHIRVSLFAERGVRLWKFTFVTSSGKIRRMEGRKEQALIRRRAFFAATDLSLDFFLPFCTTQNQSVNINKGKMLI